MPRAYINHSPLICTHILFSHIKKPSNSLKSLKLSDFHGNHTSALLNFFFFFEPTYHKQAHRFNFFPHGSYHPYNPGPCQGPIKAFLYPHLNSHPFSNLKELSKILSNPKAFRLLWLFKGLRICPHGTACPQPWMHYAVSDLLRPRRSLSGLILRAISVAASQERLVPSLLDFFISTAN